MDHWKNIQKRLGVDIGYNGSPLHPEDGIGRVGKAGMDMNFTLNEMIEISYNMKQKPNILIKAGKKAKWYIKKCDISHLEIEIEKQKWRNGTKRCTMYIIEWE